MKNSQLVKRNTVAGGYTKIYPLAYIQGITDGVTGKALVSILQSFNHIYLPFLGTVEDTRMSLPIDYRRKGIAFKVLGMLVKECYARNITAISLEATDMGRPLYEKYGFIKMEHEMELPKIQNGERK